MRCSDREYFERRQAEEDALAREASPYGAPVHRALAEEYARRIALIDREGGTGAANKKKRRRDTVGEARQM